VRRLRNDRAKQGALTLGTVAPEGASAGGRPITPLAAMTLVLVFPRRTFERLRERPHWLLPLAFVGGASLLSAVYAVRGGFMAGFFGSMGLRSGWDPARIESGFLASAVLVAIVVVPLVTLLEALFFKLAGTLFGGRARFRVVFSAVAYASVPAGIGALLFAALLPITKSVTVGANLSFLIDPATRPGLWSLVRQVDLFAVWFFLLLGIAAEPIFLLTRRRARLAAALFAAVYVAVMAMFGIGDAEGMADPYEQWLIRETPEAAIHYPPEVPSGALDEVSAAVAAARARAVDLTGADIEGRIDCYVYPSVDDKVAITDDGGLAHGVEWAGAVHVAWTEGAEVALTRELMKVIALRTLGNVYNPLVVDGLVIYAGGRWDGGSVVERAAELREAGTLPAIGDLLEPPTYRRLPRERAGPAAGAFVAFLLDELGTAGYRDLHSSAGEAVSLRRALEEAIGDSLPAIERRWLMFLENAAGERDEGGP